METILDKELDLSDNSIFNSSLTQSIKDGIVSAAEEKVNEIKENITAEIKDIDCPATRRLVTYEVDEYGSQRMLQNDVTFDALETAIKSIDDSVLSVSAGYFPGRSEIAIDVGIHVEQEFGTADFEDALTTVFGYLDSAKAMFGVSDGSVNATELMDNANAAVEFDLSLR